MTTHTRSVMLLSALSAVACRPSRQVTPAADAGPVARVDASRPGPATTHALSAFGSADALRAYTRDVLARRAQVNRRAHGAASDMAAEAAPTPTAAAAPLAAAPPAQAAQGTTNGPGAPAGGGESITNNQVQGVDEGDIVKMHGDHMVILRRGRLFSVRMGDASLTPVSMRDAFGPSREPAGWYDEMLVDGDTIVVIGYSYAGGGTEVGLFDIDAVGNIQWRDTLFVRSADYYSARNYASRLVGHHLVLYMPIPMLGYQNEEAVLPAVRHGHGASWQSVVDYTRLYRPSLAVGWMPTVHTVMSCDLSNRGFDCRAVGVVGPASRTFYVSGSAVYLWVQGQTSEDIDLAPNRRPEHPTPPVSVVYRMPLDCGPIGAVKARGAPLDQFSFDDNGRDLRVLLRAEGGGDAMWNPEATSGDVGFMHVPLARFTDDVPTVERTAYRGLPRVEGNVYSMQNRFVGDRLLYGAGNGWNGDDGVQRPRAVNVYDVARDTTATLAIGHSVERIEPIGRDALVVGQRGGDLTFTAVALDDTPTLAGSHTVPGASQGETRSHGFFYRPDGDRRGTMGLPITRGADGGGWQQLTQVSGSVMFLGVEGLQFRELGSLRSGPARAEDDHCRASCTDWYGNARPIFWRGRTFALMGYELVEGAFENGRIVERGRVDFLRALRTAPGANAFDHIPD